MDAFNSVLTNSRVKTYWEGGAWMEPYTTSKLLALSHFHIKEKSVLKAYWANIPWEKRTLKWNSHIYNDTINSGISSKEFRCSSTLSVPSIL